MEDRYAYDVEWKDPRTGVVWNYQLYLYPDTGEVEMFDTKNHKTFLKRCLVGGTRMVPEVLRPGATVTVLSRQLCVLGFSDKFTCSRLELKQARTLAMIKPDAVDRMGSVVDLILRAGFLIGELKMCLLTRDEAEQFYACHRQQPFFVQLIDFMTSGRIVAMELLSEGELVAKRMAHAGAVAEWRKLLGPTDSDVARREAPGTIRALFGTDKTQNACHGSDAPQTAKQECDLFFRQKVGRCWGYQSSSLCIVKPHAIAAKQLGSIITAILEHFDVTAAQTCHFSPVAAAELLEAYQGVLPLSDFSGIVEDLCSGASVALEVSSKGKPDPTYSPVDALRELCGPADPVLAQAVRPDTLRARFGSTRVLNAVHCTDLEEDATREIGIVFS